MDQEFAKLRGEYSSTDTSEERKVEIRKEMCGNLIKRNGGSNRFSDRLVINVDDSTIEKLYEADGILNRQEMAQKREDASSAARKSALEKNKYSSDNPYPPKVNDHDTLQG